MESSDVESIGTPYNVALGLGEQGIAALIIVFAVIFVYRKYLK